MRPSGSRNQQPTLLFALYDLLFILSRLEWILSVNESQLYFPEVLYRFLESNVLGKIDYSTVLIQINRLVMWINS